MSFKTDALKRLDSVLGAVLCRVAAAVVKPRKAAATPLPSRSSPLEICPDPKILVIRPGGIGDAALLFPALKALRDAFPAARIDVLAEKRNGGILVGCPFINATMLYDSNPPIVLLRALRKGYDIVLDTEQWHRLSALLAYLTRAPVRVGFDTNDRGAMFTHRVAYSHGEYEAKSFLSLVTSLTGVEYGFDAESRFIPPLASDGAGSSPLESEIARLRLECGSLVGIFPGATVPERMWGVESFSLLAERFAGAGIGVVILGGKAEAEDGIRLEKAVDGGKALNLTAKTYLMETAAVISLLDLFVTSDTGLLHVAYGVGTPTLSLFGAGIEEKWAPRGASHRVINKRPPCSPCTRFGYTPKCPYGVKCLGDITPDEVFEEALTMLASVEKQPSP